MSSDITYTITTGNVSSSFISDCHNMLMLMGVGLFNIVSFVPSDQCFASLQNHLKVWHIWSLEKRKNKLFSTTYKGSTTTRGEGKSIMPVMSLATQL